MGSTDIQDYTIDRLRNLVSVQTVNPPRLNYVKCAELLGADLQKFGFETEFLTIPEEYLDKYYPYAPLHQGHPRVVVLGRRGSGKPILHFNGHYDVVPAGIGWVRDPFVPSMVEGRIYGRGTTDMKGGIAAILGSLNAIRISNLTLDGTLEIAFVPDEESGGMGTRYLVESGRTKPDYVIIAEPTHPPIAGVGIGHKGMVRGVVRVFGRQVHGSTPWRGENAFVKASMLVSEFTKDYERLLMSKTTMHPTQEAEAKHPTINLGGSANSLSGKDNSVSGEFTFSFDRRVIPEEDMDEVIRELEKSIDTAAHHVNARYELRVLSAVLPSVTPLDSRLVTIASKCIKSRHRVDALATISAGRNDAVYYNPVKAEVINWGPGVQETAHAADEYTTVSELTQAVENYKDIIKELLGSGAA